MPVKKTGLYKLNGGSGPRAVTPGPTRPPGILHIRKNKIKVSPLTGLQMGKNYVFRNPRYTI